MLKRFATIPDEERDSGRPAASVALAPRRAVIAIGASTGGPSAVRELLSALPAPFPIPLLLTIHIAEPFGATFASWLDGHAGHRARLATDGEPLFLPQAALRLAPPNRHLLIAGGRLRLSDAPERHSCRPSIDTLFESMAHEVGTAGIACLLTGMGRDGAAGLLAVRQAGGFTIAQDEATSAVYGMPREAARLGAARRVLPLPAIGPALAGFAARA
jgi:two-component system chemotaxis response regulator CheB